MTRGVIVGNIIEMVRKISCGCQEYLFKTPNSDNSGGIFPSSLG